MVTINQIKQLRQETRISITECKKALEEARGDIKRAKEVLRRTGKEVVRTKQEREAREGMIESYIHPNKKIGAIVELRCESDFVARSQDFQKLAHELCLQVAAMNPLFLKTEDVPEKFLSGERKIYQEQIQGSGKPEKITNEIVEGKLKKYKEEISLISQSWIRDETKTIKELIDEYITRLGENIIVKRYVRYEL